MIHLDSSFSEDSGGWQFVCYLRQKHHAELLLLCSKSCASFGVLHCGPNDLLIEFYILVYYKFEQVRAGYEKFGLSYLRTIIRRTLINEWKKMGSRKRREELFMQARPEHTTLFKMSADDFQDQFFEIMKDLLTKEQYAVMDLYLQGYAYKEISAKLKVPIGTVGTRIKKSRQIIADHFGINPEKPGRIELF